MLAMDCMHVTLIDVLKSKHVPRWNFLDIHSEDVYSTASRGETEIKYVHFVGGVILPKCSARIRVTMFHPHGCEWEAHSVEIRTWNETEREEDGKLSLFSATEMRELFSR